MRRWRLRLARRRHALFDAAQTIGHPLDLLCELIDLPPLLRDRRGQILDWALLIRRAYPQRFETRVHTGLTHHSFLTHDPEQLVPDVIRDGKRSSEKIMLKTMPPPASAPAPPGHAPAHPRRPPRATRTR